MITISITILSIVIFFGIMLIVSYVYRHRYGLTNTYVAKLVISLVTLITAIVAFLYAITYRDEPHEDVDVSKNTFSETGATDTKRDSDSITSDSDSNFSISFGSNRSAPEPKEWSMTGNSDFAAAAALQIQDKAAAQKKYTKQCKSKNAASCTQLALIYLKNDETPKDLKKGILLLLGTCTLGYKYACSELARSYQDKTIRKLVKERELKSSDEDAALNALISACSNEQIEACDAVGVAYRNGVGVQKNPAMSANYFKQSCELVKKLPETAHKDPHGCTNLADFYARGVGGFARNVLKAEELYQYSCDNDLAWACYRLGIFFQSSIGGVKAEKGRDSFEKACSLGHRMACELLESTSDSQTNEVTKESSDNNKYHMVGEVEDEGTGKDNN